MVVNKPCLKDLVIQVDVIDRKVPIYKMVRHFPILGQFQKYW